MLGDSASGAATVRPSYELQEEQIKLGSVLGHGTFGTVYRGECFGLAVAVKVPFVGNNTNAGAVDGNADGNDTKAEADGNADGDSKKPGEDTGPTTAAVQPAVLSKEDMEDLKQEIRIMTTSLHPNLILCLGACHAPDKFRIVLELMDGDLETLLIQSPMGKKMSLFQRMCMARDAARGMQWLHSRDPAIIHRDLKLENMMYKKVGNTFQIKIADFGLSALKPKKSASLVWEKVGTVNTMAPEILQGSDYNEKADVYSFGIILWQLFTCEPLYADTEHSTEGLAFQIWRNGLRPKIPANCISTLKKLMQECWQTDFAKRPSFERINKKIDQILIQIAILDDQGRRFWKKYFFRQHNVPWQNFAASFYRFIRQRMPRNIDKTKLDTATTNYLCLKKLLARPDVEGKEFVNIQQFGQITALFGPLLRDDSHSHPCVLDEIRELLMERWFHGFVRRGEAHRRLLGRQAGSFLFRMTSKEGVCLALTLMRTEGRNPNNIYVYKNNGRFMFLGFDSRNYISLSAIIRDLERITKLPLLPCPGWPFSSCFSGVEDNLDDSDSEDYIPFLGELIGAADGGGSSAKSKDSGGNSSGDEEDRLPSPTFAAAAEENVKLKRRQLQLRQLHQLHQHQHVERQIEPSAGGTGVGTDATGVSPMSSPRSPHTAASLFDSPRASLFDSPRTSPYGKGPLSPLSGLVQGPSSLLSGAADDAGQKLLLRQDSLMALLVNDPELEERRKQREEERKEREAQWAKEEEERKRRREERRKFLTK